MWACAEYVPPLVTIKSDRNLGKILDKMDEYGLWEDTLLIVNTDHGFFLGEHGWWAKSNPMNLYEEVGPYAAVDL